MIISPGRGYIFVHVPKTGGTSLALALEDRAMKDDILIGDTPKAKRRRRRLDGLAPRGRLWKHARLSDIEGVLDRDAIHAMRIITIVRNPWDRMASYYHWLRDRSFDHPAVSRAQSLAFTGFLTHPHTVAEMRADGMRRYLTTSDGREAGAIILRHERLTEDVHTLAERLGVTLDLPHVNASRRATGYADLYDPAAREAVSRSFADDIKRFDYAF